MTLFVAAYVVMIISSVVPELVLTICGNIGVLEVTLTPTVTMMFSVDGHS